MVGVMQVEPEQQPVGQLLALQPLQTPPVQVCVAGHIEQAPPPLPHWAALETSWQMLPSQQPVQLSGSQIQLPLLQR